MLQPDIVSGGFRPALAGVFVTSWERQNASHGVELCKQLPTVLNSHSELIERHGQADLVLPAGGFHKDDALNEAVKHRLRKKHITHARLSPTVHPDTVGVQKPGAFATLIKVNALARKGNCVATATEGLAA